MKCPRCGDEMEEMDNEYVCEGCGFSTYKPSTDNKDYERTEPDPTEGVA